MWLRIAVMCALGPMLTGTAVFLLFVLTRSDPFMVIGLGVIGLGVISFLIGTCFFAAYVARERRPRLTWKNVGVVALLLLNFPLAMAYTVGGTYLHTQYVVVIENRSTSPLNQIIIRGPGVFDDVPALAPGAKVMRRMHIGGDGQLILTASRGGKPIEFTISSYVTNGMGGRVSVVVTDSGVQFEPPAAK